MTVGTEEGCKEDVIRKWQIGNKRGEVGEGRKREGNLGDGNYG